MEPYVIEPREYIAMLVNFILTLPHVEGLLTKREVCILWNIALRFLVQTELGQRARSVLKNRSPICYCTDRTSEVNKLFITWQINPSLRKKAFVGYVRLYQQQNSLGNVFHVIHFILACQREWHNFLLGFHLLENVIENLLIRWPIGQKCCLAASVDRRTANDPIWSKF